MVKKQENAKDIILSELAKLPEMALATAYLNAVSMSKYGVDVANAWLTAVQQSGALERAYQDGYYKALKECHERQSGSWVTTDIESEYYGEVFKCSNCGTELLRCSCRRFCPECGAFMTFKRGED